MGGLLLKDQLYAAVKRANDEALVRGLGIAKSVVQRLFDGGQILPRIIGLVFQV